MRTYLQKVFAVIFWYSRKRSLYTINRLWRQRAAGLSKGELIG